MPPGGAADDAEGGCWPGASLPCLLGPRREMIEKITFYGENDELPEQPPQGCGGVPKNRRFSRRSWTGCSIKSPLGSLFPKNIGPDDFSRSLPSRAVKYCYKITAELQILGWFLLHLLAFLPLASPRHPNTGARVCRLFPPSPGRTRDLPQGNTRTSTPS